jgi:hypothetical protein
MAILGRFPRSLSRSKVLLGASLALALGLGLGHARGRLEDVPSKPADPLLALNDHFHAAYRQARVDRLARGGPVVLVGFQSLALLRAGKRTEVPFPPPVYHALKQVAHTPLLVYVMLDGTKGRPLDAVKRAEVSYVRDLLDASIAGLDRAAYPPASVDRQLTILKSTRVYLAGVLEAGLAPGEALQGFARSLAPLMLANADDAAAAHLAALDAQMQAWRGELSADEWRSMHVVVMSVHMARDREIAMQYFTRLLGETSEGHRLIFAEGLFEEPKALDLLGTHLLDGAASAAFFGDEMRLHRDLLSDGATKALDKMTIRP